MLTAAVFLSALVAVLASSRRFDVAEIMGRPSLFRPPPTREVFAEYGFVDVPVRPRFVGAAEFVVAGDIDNPSRLRAVPTAWATCAYCGTVRDNDARSCESCGAPHRVRTRRMATS